MVYFAPLTMAVTRLNPITRGGLRALIDFYDDRRARGLPLVATTVIDTAGSTYRKSGAMMLIAGDGTWQGLLSGGCLEGDLAMHARDVADDGRPRIVAYDLEAMTDAVFGFGLGCEGAVTVLLERLGPENDWEPFASIARVALAGAAADIVRVIESADPELPVGTWALRSESHGSSGSQTLLARAQKDGTGAETTVRLHVAPVSRIPMIVLMGAAPDAMPLIRFAVALGWRVLVVDHRRAYVDRRRLDGADDVLLADGQELPRDLDLGRADAIVVMSHNLEADARYLAAALRSKAQYIGLLGPMHRKIRLLEMVQVAPEDQGRIHGPAGLDLGGEGPEAIALAIIAEIQTVLQGRSAHPLRRPAARRER
jgi:xanthine/CO dehydrogenase XdhC/CoxF family maturation factor